LASSNTPKPRLALTAAQIAEAVGARAPSPELAELRVSGIATDSRALPSASLFIALEGANFDGHHFIDAAVAAGAVAVLCRKGRAEPRKGVAFIEVADTQRALGDLAAWHRRRFDVPIIAVTGSNGKTTTKEILRGILGHAFSDEAVLATEGNLNNLIGMPLTLLGLRPEHQVAVLEMGMNAPGEIARLVEIARPTVGVVTCVGEAHLEGLGSIEGVARAKGEMFAGLPPDAVAVVNMDDPFVRGEAPRFAGKHLGFGSKAAVRAEQVELDGLQGARFRLSHDAQSAAVDLPLGGRHNVQNALAAAAAVLAIGVDLETVAAGIAQTQPPPMRLKVEHLGNGVLLVNDAYNANPGSVAASLGVLAESYPGRCAVVLGEMLELGPRAAELHRRVGAEAAAAKPRLLLALGGYGQEIVNGAIEAGMSAENARVVSDHGAAAAAVADIWEEGDAVLVKGSRGSAMEQVADALQKLAASQSA
jgi:UDP-N-acetylmuramoyl-tripeptide--D-alanyl-D-alanine ligase